MKKLIVILMLGAACAHAQNVDKGIATPLNVEFVDWHSATMESHLKMSTSKDLSDVTIAQKPGTETHVTVRCDGASIVIEKSGDVPTFHRWGATQE